MLTLYDILQVSEDAEPEVVQAAYLRLSRKYHPDVNTSSEASERMKQLNRAYEILGNAEKRRNYDEELRKMRASAGGTGGERSESIQKSSSSIILSQQDTPPRAGVPWNIGDAIRGVLIAFIGSIVLLEVAILITRFLAGVKEDRLPPPAVFASTLLVEVLLVAVAWRFTVHKYGVEWKALGIRPLEKPGHLLLILGALIAGFTANAVYAIIVTSLGLKPLKPPPLPYFTEESTSFAMMAVLAVLIAPIAEEMFFRGFLFPAFRKRWGGMAAAAITAGLFSLAHFSVGVLIPVFILGLLLAWLYSQTHSIFACIAFHMVNNGVALAAGLSAQ